MSYQYFWQFSEKEKKKKLQMHISAISETCKTHQEYYKYP